MSNLRDFVRFTREDFENALVEALKPHKEQGARLFRENNPGEEIVYIVPVGTDKRLYFKVYSTVNPQTGVSRDYGEDAIRFALLDKKSEKPLLERQPHVKRIVNWRSNLGNRIEKMFEEAQKFDQSCNICGATKIERVNRQTNQTFMGCINFRNHPPR